MSFQGSFDYPPASRFIALAIKLRFYLIGIAILNALADCLQKTTAKDYQKNRIKTLP